jgi:hypothetical protein
MTYLGVKRGVIPLTTAKKKLPKALHAGDRQRLSGPRITFAGEAGSGSLRKQKSRFSCGRA